MENLITFADASANSKKLFAHIYANKSVNGYKGRLKDLSATTPVADLELWYNACPMQIKQETSQEDLSNIANIQSHTAKNGTMYQTIALPLIEINNGINFKFQFGEKLVSVSYDMDLYHIWEETPELLEVGTLVRFNYEGSNSFRPLGNGNLLVANTDDNNRYRGTISKSNNPIFENSLIKKEEKEMQRKSKMIKTASKLGVTVNKVRQVVNKNLDASILAEMSL